MAKRKAKACGGGRFKQLTLAQSLSGSVAAVEMSDSGKDRGAGDATKEIEDRIGGEESVAGCSGAPPQFGGVPRGSAAAEGSPLRLSGDGSDSEPDPDSSSDWIPSESSRESSPDLGEPTEDLRSKVPNTSRGRAPARGRGARRRQSLEVDAGVWGHDGWKPTKFPFVATPGPQNAAADLDSDQPVDFMQLFLTEELLGHIVSQTNLYARQFIQAHPEALPHSRERVWKPVNVPELKKYLGLTFLTGYIKKPSVSMYWSEDPMEAIPYFNNTMPRNRFQLIGKFLHFNDNASQDAGDKLYKVRPVLDSIISKFKELYQPHENICIDEGMLQWRGRLNFRVYNPQKPVKYGIKSYILCDSRTGYCYNMLPYVGQPSTLPDIVFSLLDRLTEQGYTIFMDNFYNSVKLCEQLCKKKTNVCGTLRKNRGEPQIIREPSKTDLGEEGKVVRHNGRVLVLAWQDKRLVRMITTCHNDRMQRVEVWQKGQREKVAQFKPECVVQYNSCMNGVDKLDQNIAYYPFIRKTQNWTKKFVAYLFQICVYNAYVLFRSRNPGIKKSHLDFMKDIARSWTEKGYVSHEEGEEMEVEDVLQTRSVRNRDPEGRLDGLMSRHKLERLRATTKKAHPSRKCRVCARRGGRSETRMWCKACRIPLHAGECFTVYHTQKKYN
ncbi:piggyBac transposable element-derived protein 4-like [Antennarius striatus]|uniref:piggyBac transposable element-derived protein 4-like n=1 Tax=Antennarius striatus TaxID=241820 RepID=UPI0035AFE3C0